MENGTSLQAELVGTSPILLAGTLLATADNVLAVSDYWHYRLDAGDLLGVASPALWGSGAVSAIHNLIVPTSDIKIRLLARGSADMQFRLHVAPTISDSGTEVITSNFDQTVAAPAAGATFYHTAALSATGTLLYDKYIPAGSAGGPFGAGKGEGGSDWGLAAGTIYNLVVIAHAIGTFAWSGEFYSD